MCTPKQPMHISH